MKTALQAVEGHANPDSRVAGTATRDFRQTDEGSFSMTLLELGIEFQANYLRRERYETFDELVVCNLAGARTIDGNVISRGTFDFSSTEARGRRAKQLADMSRAPELEWPRLLEEVCARILAKHGDGEPAVLLRDLLRPSPDELLDVDGLRLLKRHPVILFGDGGAAKSYLALFVAGRLAQRGLRVGIFDWELAGEDHRVRLERLFGADMPPVWYRSCRHPLVVELDSLRRVVRREHLDYLIYDSVAFAAHDKPEAAESALRYFSARRQIGPGSLHVAHVTKTDGADQKPFGSAFWHNSARSTYFVQRARVRRRPRRQDRGVQPEGQPRRPSGRVRVAVHLRRSDRTLVTRTNLAGVHRERTRRSPHLGTGAARAAGVGGIARR